MDRFIREAECKTITGLGRTTRWEMERRGAFPARHRLTDNTIGWLESEVRAWMESRRARTTNPYDLAITTHIPPQVASRRRVPSTSGPRTRAAPEGRR